MVALKIVLMAHTAWMMGDAIIRTLYRLFVSRKHLLEWRTASQAHKSGDNTLISYYRMMYGAVVIAADRPRSFRCWPIRPARLSPSSSPSSGPDRRLLPG